uniref:Uncharacterized protein n=1 Tax=uncultured marine thaumarchaeote AD1000_21_E03 TaxID=1455900 RepID=A0A075FRI4_9ARCH|nr:hypothetical protein [uncultured marine thaumarchaeote AD1000_21_E03]
MSFPYASNRMSNACHLAANSTFHASFPRSFVISDSPSCPQPLIILEPISESLHLYLIFFSSSIYSKDSVVYNLSQFLQTGKYGRIF